MTVLLWVLFGLYLINLVARVACLAGQKYPKQIKAKDDGWGVVTNLAIALAILYAILVWQ